MASSSNDIWAKLIAMDPHKEDISIESQQNEVNEYKPNIGWRIYQKSTGETCIINYSAPSIKIGDVWLEVDQEKEISGGERVSFNQSKESKDQAFNYVFCWVGRKPQNNNKRNREESSEPSNFPSNSEVKKLTKMNSDLCEELGCLICTEILHQCVTLHPCQHSFCSSCLLSSFKTSVNCPLCRVEATFVAKNLVLQKVARIISKNPLDGQKPKIEQRQTELEGIILRNEEGLYIGSVQNLRKEGKGTMIYSNENIYEGTWKIGKREGKGVLKLKNGNKYEGIFKNDLYNGLGKFSWANGDEFEGNFIDGRRNGYGTLRKSNGDLYIGNWKDGEKEGEGILIYKDGYRYEGSWRKDCFHGKGKYTWKDGREYEGDWANDNRNGTGKIKYPDGRIYEGKWNDDEKQGDGVLTLANGDKYEGSWANDVLQSVRKIYYANGDIYEGEAQVKSFKKHGEGVMTYKNGDQYHGSWENDKRHGSGREISLNGKRVFKGVWKEGVMIGEVLMIDENGKKYIAEWKEIGEGHQQNESKEQGKSKNKGDDDEDALFNLYVFKCIAAKGRTTCFKVCKY